MENIDQSTLRRLVADMKTTVGRRSTGDLLAVGCRDQSAGLVQPQTLHVYQDLPSPVVFGHPFTTL